MMLDTLQIATDTPDIGAIVKADVRPFVRDIDERGLYPEAALRRLGNSGCFAHHLGGQAARGGLARAIADMAAVGQSCISTAFCMWCQDALGWYLDRSDNDLVRRRYLEEVGAGRRLGGTGLSNPMKSLAGIEPLALSGETVTGGYRVSGRLPWVSNLGDDHLFASILALPDGRRVMALFDCSREGVTISQNAHFIALEGTRTFTVMLRDVLVGEAQIIADDAAAFVPRIRQGFVLLQLGMALGAARGAADVMRADASGAKAAAWLPLPPGIIDERADAIAARADSLASTHDDPSRAAFLEVLRLRLDASWLALEATQSVVLQAGARGYLAGSDAHRRQREAQFVAIVTPSIKHITKELAAG